MNAAGRSSSFFFRFRKSALIHGPGKRSRADQTVRALFHAIAAHPFMKLLLLLPKLQHISQNSHPAGRGPLRRVFFFLLREQVYGGLHRNRIGVIAVVDHNTASRLQNAASAADAPDIRDAGCDLLLRKPQQEACRRRRQRIIHHMLSRKRDADRKFLSRMAEHSFASQKPLHPDIPGVHVAASGRSGFRPGAGDSIGHRLSSLHLPNRRKHVVVPVQHGAAVFLHEVKDLRFCLQDAFPASQKLQMALADIGHHADIRLRDPAQTVHFPEMVDPHLQHGHLRILRHGKDGEGDADLIVKVSLRLMYPVFPGKHRRNKFLGAGLSHAPGDAYHLYGKLFSVKRRDLPQRLQAVLHQNAGPCRVFRQTLADNAQRAFFKYVRDKTVSVHPLSLHGDEKAVFPRLSGIDHHGRALRPRQFSRKDQPAAAGPCQIFKRHMFHQNLPSESLPSGRSASFRIHSHRSSNSTPMALASWGIREVGVMPGSVFASRQ